MFGNEPFFLTIRFISLFKQATSSDLQLTVEEHREKTPCIPIPAIQKKLIMQKFYYVKNYKLAHDLARQAKADDKLMHSKKQFSTENTHPNNSHALNMVLDANTK